MKLACASSHSRLIGTHARAVSVAGRSLAVSLITLAEIEYGMEAKNWGASRRDLMRRFLARFTPLLPDRIVGLLAGSVG
jgi:predicted nucleic acid-binding protein